MVISPAVTWPAAQLPSPTQRVQGNYCRKGNTKKELYVTSGHIQKNCCNFWTNAAIFISFENYNVLNLCYKVHFMIKPPYPTIKAPQLCNNFFSAWRVTQGHVAPGQITLLNILWGLYNKFYVNYYKYFAYSNACIYGGRYIITFQFSFCK